MSVLEYDKFSIEEGLIQKWLYEKGVTKNGIEIFDNSIQQIVYLLANTFSESASNVSISITKPSYTPYVSRREELPYNLTISVKGVPEGEDKSRLLCRIPIPILIGSRFCALRGFDPEHMRQCNDNLFNVGCVYHNKSGVPMTMKAKEVTYGDILTVKHEKIISMFNQHYGGKPASRKTTPVSLRFTHLTESTMLSTLGHVYTVSSVIYFHFILPRNKFPENRYIIGNFCEIIHVLLYYDNSEAGKKRNYIEAIRDSIINFIPAESRDKIESLTDSTFSAYARNMRDLKEMSSDFVALHLIKEMTVPYKKLASNIQKQKKPLHIKDFYEYVIAGTQSVSDKINTIINLMVKLLTSSNVTREVFDKLIADSTSWENRRTYTCGSHVGRVVADRLNRNFSTGNMSVKTTINVLNALTNTNDTVDSLHGYASQSNPIETISETTITTQMGERVTAANRGIGDAAVGSICQLETPESKKTGMVKHLSSAGWITLYRETDRILSRLTRYGVFVHEGEVMPHFISSTPTKLNLYKKVIVNDIVRGWVTEYRFYEIRNRYARHCMFFDVIFNYTKIFDYYEIHTVNGYFGHFVCTTLYSWINGDKTKNYDIKNEILYKDSLVPVKSLLPEGDFFNEQPYVYTNTVVEKLDDEEDVFVTYKHDEDILCVAYIEKNKQHLMSYTIDEIEGETKIYYYLNLSTKKWIRCVHGADEIEVEKFNVEDAVYTYIKRENKERFYKAMNLYRENSNNEYIQHLPKKYYLYRGEINIDKWEVYTLQEGGLKLEDATTDQLINYGYLTFVSVKTHGHNLENSYTALTRREFYECPDKFVYVEMHPSAISSVVVNAVPFKAHVYAPRQSLHGHMSKSAIVKDIASLASFSGAARLIAENTTPPLVNDPCAGNVAEVCPSGVNVVFGMLTNSFRNEDSYGVSSTTLKECFGKYRYTTISISFFATRNDPRFSTEEGITFELLEKPTCKNLINSVHNLTEFGIPKLNTYYRIGDVVLGKHVLVGRDKKPFDTSVKIKSLDESGWLYNMRLHNVTMNPTYKKLSISANSRIELVFCDIREGKMGDKTFMRYAQKGTFALPTPAIDMPVIVSGKWKGTRLGMLGSSFMLMSRLTPGLVVEQLAGAVAAMECVKVNAGYINSNNVSNLLMRLKLAGIDTEYQTVLLPTGNLVKMIVGVTYTAVTRHVAIDASNYRSNDNILTTRLRTHQQGKGQKGGNRFGMMEIGGLASSGSSDIIKNLFESSLHTEIIVCLKCGKFGNISDRGVCPKCGHEQEKISTRHGFNFFRSCLLGAGLEIRLLK